MNKKALINLCLAVLAFIAWIILLGTLWQESSQAEQSIDFVEALDFQLTESAKSVLDLFAENRAKEQARQQAIYQFGAFMISRHQVQTMSADELARLDLLLRLVDRLQPDEETLVKMAETLIPRNKWEIKGTF